MLQKFKNIDGVFLVGFILLSVIRLVEFFASGYVLSIHNYLAFILLAVALYFKISKSGKLRFSVALILFLATFNIISFTISRDWFSINYSSGNIVYSTPGINLYVVVFFMGYCFWNFDYLKSLFTGSHEERKIEEEKMIDFYYNKFADSSFDEYKTVLSNIDSYPEEARIALERLKEERKV